MNLRTLRQKKGALQGVLDEEVGCPKSYIKFRVKQASFKKWENQWLNKSQQQKLIKLKRRGLIIGRQNYS